MEGEEEGGEKGKDEKIKGKKLIQEWKKKEREEVKKEKKEDRGQ